ncbi:MAG: peptidase [Myxococcota bacterium]|nr:peptidase [Myxococcota bacterium]
MRLLRQTICVAGLLFLAACADRAKPVDKPQKEDTVTPNKTPPTPVTAKTSEDGSGTSTEPKIKSLIAEFVPVTIGVDEAKIPKVHRPVIQKLVEAAKIIDRLFLNQVSAKNEQWRAELAANPAMADTLTLFDIMYGPWNRLDHDKPFWGDQEKPKGATFYPEDMTQKELEAWIEAHPEQKAAFTGYFTIIERDGPGLKAVPYNSAYKTQLEPAAKRLEEAAALAKDKRLKKYLRARAKAFRDNEYRQSDMDWMDLGNGDLEVVIGPYEVYEDQLMGYKAAFEAFITLRDAEASAKLDQIKALIPDMEAYLPIPDAHKNPGRGSESPISVVDVLFTAGDTRAGVQTLAFNLPNDEVVREKKGFKLVILKNISHAKFDQILIPIAKQLMRPDQVANISFEAFFNHSLVHETAHGLGPGKITVERDGKKIKTTVNQELKELYPAIEETKADILGTYLNNLLIEKGLFKKDFMETTYASLLGGFFRSVRFGASKAHGQANLIQFNWLKEKGAIIVENDKYVYVKEKMPEAIKSLTVEVLMIEALGDYDRAKRLIDQYGQMPPDLKKALAGLSGIPTDLRPSYQIEQQLAAWQE